MALTKRVYVDGRVVISAENLNEIQDCVITLEQNAAKTELDLMGKADGAYVENGYLFLTSNGEVVAGPIGPFASSGGGGGGGSANNAVLTVSNTTGWISKTVAAGGSCPISVSWSSIENDVETGDGALKITVNNQVKATANVKQGELNLEIGSYLDVGSNSVKITITDVYGNARTLFFSITAEELTLTSTFDASSAFTGAITYTYIPTGSVEKTVYFILDGEEYATATVTTSGRQQSCHIEAQPHGVHTFEVYFEAEVDGDTVRSNRLYYELTCIEEGNTTPIVTCPFTATEIEQYATVSIPYTVYDPSTLTAEVVLAVDGEQVATLTVDRTRQIWSYRPLGAGNVKLTISCGKTTKKLELTVKESSVKIEAETEALALHLSSYGRSNNEENPGTWAYGDIAAEFSGFNYVSDGWKLDDDNISVLRISGDARLTIPYKMFANDFRTTGKTIEIEFATRDVLNYDATILSCFSGNRGIQMTAQKVTLKSEQSEISTQYKEDEHVRITFVVEKKSENRLIYCYINGVMSGVLQYPADDDFSQSNPVGFTIGSSECTMDIYAIRVYDNDLTRFQVLDNWIADTQDGALRIERYTRNAVFDAYGQIVIPNLPNNLPYLIIEAEELPQYKGDEKTVTGSYTNNEDESKSFTFESATADIQGTSSATYARKNYKIKFKGGFVNIGGTTTETYQMRGNSIGTDTFTFKADVASSEGANNVELVRLYNDICPFKTPPQEEDPRVRQGIDGFPIVIFWYDGKNTTFLGKYNFNNDKGTPEVFGMDSNDESWEILNNTSDRVLWKSANYSGSDWKNDFEARHPKNNTNITRLKAFAEWLVTTDQSAATGGALSRAVTYETGETDDEGNAITVTYTNDTAEYRLAKFVAELGDHAEVDGMLFNYLFTELFLMVDNRAKNAFPTYYDGGKWTILPYDFDTAIGTNNEGALVFSYELEDIDKTASGADVYNGQNSVLYINIRQGFQKRLMEMYQTLRSEGKLSYADTEQRFEDHQNKWPEAIFNEDSYFKYLAPLVAPEGSDKPTAAYLSMLQGSKAEQRKWWLYNRYRYIDSKYNAGDALTDVITVRGYAKSDITVRPYADIYASVKYGSYLVQTRALRGSSYTLECPLDNVNDTEIYIYSASQLAEVGDLSGLKVGYAEFSMATKLQSLKLGDGSASYSNANLTELYLGNNTLLKTLDVRNCPNLGLGDVQQSVDISGCTNIEEVYFDGTSITGLTLPNGGILKVLHLPGTVTNLTLRNQTALTDFTMPSYANVTTLWVENVSNVVDPMAILMQLPANSRVRIIGFDFAVDSVATISAGYDLLDTMRGLDENGNNTDKAQLSGTIHIDSLTSAELAALKSRYPTITIAYNHISFYVRYYNTDGELLHTAMCNEGDDVIDPVANGTIDAPTMAATEDTMYVYSGWDSLPTNISGDCTVTAKYVESYRVLFYNEGVLANTQWIQNGLDAVEPIAAGYIGTPTKAYTAQYAYTFSGWDTEFTNVTGPLTVNATYTATVRKYTVWYYNDSTLLQTVTDVPYGSSVSYTGDTPVKTGVDDTSDYEFIGFSPDGTSIVGDTKCYAMYKYVGAISVVLVDRTISGDYENDRVVTVGPHAFNGCTSLVSVSFPEVTTVEGSAFFGCTKLTTVDLAKVQSIGAYVFKGCSALVTLILRAGTVCTLGVDSLTNTPIASGTGYIYVPSALVSSYKAATNWSNFSSQIRAIEDYPDICGG